LLASMRSHSSSTSASIPDPRRHQSRAGVAHHQRPNQRGFRFVIGLLNIVHHNFVAIHKKHFDVWTRRHFMIFLGHRCSRLKAKMNF
jgi:hypothetical protein